MSRAQLTSTVEQNTGGVISPYVAGKNFIANGNFDWWQRGTTFSSPTAYTADRWYSTTVGTVTFSQETSVVPNGSTYAMKWTTGAGSSYGSILQAFEDKDVNLMAGNTITLSALVRAQASFSGNATMYIETNTTANTMTGGTWTQVASLNYAPSTSAYGKMQLSYAVPAGTKGIRVNLVLGSAQASGTGLYWSQVQLELGPVATPFSRAGGTLSGELALCQRYYWRSTTGYNYGFVTPFCGSAGNSTTVAYFTIPIPVPMRLATPTSIDYSNIGASDGANIYTGSWGISTSSTIYPMVYVNTTGLVNYRPLMIQANNSSTAYFGLSAEL